MRAYRQSFLFVLLLFSCVVASDNELHYFPHATQPLMQRDMLSSILNFLKYTINPQVETLVANTGCGSVPITSTGIATLPTVITTQTTITVAGDYCLGADIIITGEEGVQEGIIISVNDVTLNLNGKTISNTGTGTIGVHVSSGVSRVRIYNGSIVGMTDSGIKIEGTNCVVSNSIAMNNAIGISLVTASDNMIQNCLLITNTSAGISLTSTCTLNIINNCMALATTGSSTTVVSGFLANGGNSNIFTNCIADGTQKTTNTGGIIVAGFRFTGNEARSEISFCTSANTIAAVGTDVAFGIVLDTGCDDCVVQANLGHGTRGGTGGTGFSGQTAAGENLFIDNVAFANGTNYSLTSGTNSINNRQGT